MARSPNDPIGSLLDVLTPAEKAQIPWINMPPGYGPQGGVPTDQSYRVAGDIPDANRNGQVPPINMPPEYGPSGGIQPLYQPPDVGGIRQMQQNVTGGIGKFLGIPDAIAALRGQMTPEEAQMFALGALPGLLPGARGEQVAAEAAPAVARGIRAFHGSPHDFPAFDISKIGTGEGAQAYGHGLYFAENPQVAREYKNKLADPKQYTVPMTLDGRPVAGRGANSWVKVQSDMWDKKDNEGAFLAQMLGDANRYNVSSMGALKKLYQTQQGLFPWNNPFGPGEKGFNAAFKALRERADFAPRRGRMYEVNINADPEHFLDWDKPLSEQSPKVQQAISQLTQGKDPQAFGQSGSGLYNFVGAWKGRQDQNASDALRQAGIPGIKYLDQGSRNFADLKIEPHEFNDGSSGFKVNGPKGDMTFDTKQEAQQYIDSLNKGQTHNYVVFDDKLIDIIKKYGIAGLIGANASNWSPKND